MKKTRSIVLAVLTAIPFAGSVGVAGGPFRIATAEEVPTGLINPGTVRCIGGAQVGLFCMPGTKRTHVRGQIVSAIYVNLQGEAAELINGTNTITANCNFDQSLKGPCWGTFSWLVPGAGGQWDGTWNGQFDLLNNTSSYSAVAQGSGGDLDGLQLKVEAVHPAGSEHSSLVCRISGQV
jgi:hypothetical protein